MLSAFIKNLRGGDTCTTTLMTRTTTDLRSARDDDIMWVFCRISYHLATPAIAALVRTEHIYKAQRFYDHAPITVDYEMTI